MQVIALQSTDTAVFYCFPGEREAVFQASKELFYDLHTLVVEERPDDSVILRRILRSEKLSTIRAATLDLANTAQEASKLVAAAETTSEPAESVSLWILRDKQHKGKLLARGVGLIHDARVDQLIRG